MFVIHYVDNCSSHIAKHNVTDVKVISRAIFGHELTILMGGVLGLLGHLLAIVVLCRRQSAGRLGSIRLNLAILSSSEIGLNLFVIAFAMQNLLLPDYTIPDVPLLIYSTIVFWNINALVCSRNWFVALIALSRCEAIFRPMESLSHQFFSGKRTFLYMFGFYLLSYLFSLVRILGQYAEICVSNNNSISYHYLLGSYKEFQYFETYCVFAYQSALPIAIVFIATIIMIYTLCSQKPVTEGQNNLHRSRQNFHRRATRTVLVLAIVFTAMEAPIFLIKLSESILIVSHEVRVNILYFMGRLLVVLDSCFNVIVYVLTGDRFRAELWILLRDIRRSFCYKDTNIDSKQGSQMSNRRRLSSFHQQYTIVKSTNI